MSSDPSPDRSVLDHLVRPGAYHDSIVLMRLQSALRGLDGVLDSGAVMATETNLALLADNNLLPSPQPEATDGDLLISIRATDADSARGALEQVDELLSRRSTETDDEWRPRSLRTAGQMLPEARWVTVSVPGRYAAAVTEDALRLGRNVFLYSDNVGLDDERRLKETARRRGLMVLGPDCGTASIGGTGLGFANRCRRGAVGLIAASGTGLQLAMTRLHELGGGVSHGIGTGGRDLNDTVGGITTMQALELLAQDPATDVIVLISKPPSRSMASKVLRRALAVGKPVVVCFLGYPAPGRRLGSLHFARDLEEAAELAAELAAGASSTGPEADGPSSAKSEQSGRRYLRGLFSGGTLAYETVLSLRAVLDPLSSNLEADGVVSLPDPIHSSGHTVVDLGADELTVGRLHPMMDPDLGRRRFAREAEDPETAVLLFDLVLGDGSHEDPAGQWVDAVAAVCALPDGPEVLCLLVGTDQDPQDFEAQRQALEEAGARVFNGLRDALDACLALLPQDTAADAPPVQAKDLEGPLAVWNVGLDSLWHSLTAQDSPAVHVEWRPPAGGDERLAALLRKMTV